MKNYNTIVLILFSIFTFGAFAGSIVFGHGFGDVFYILLSLFLLIVYGCMFTYISYKQKIKAQKIIAIIFTTVLLLLCLKATIFRGAEYSWENHGVFYK